MYYYEILEGLFMKFSGRPQDLSDITLLYKAKRFQEDGK